MRFFLKMDSDKAEHVRIFDHWLNGDYLSELTGADEGNYFFLRDERAVVVTADAEETECFQPIVLVWVEVYDTDEEACDRWQQLCGFDEEEEEIEG